jgi:hypothetical protein
MNTNRFIKAPQRRRKSFREATNLFWATTTVFTGLLCAVLYCLVTHQIPV